MESKEEIEKLLAALRSGDESPLKEIYPRYRDIFLQWALRRYPAFVEEDLLDVYQEMIIEFYLNVKKGKLESLDAKLQTYLFGIGKNLLSKKYRQNQRTDLMDDLEANKLTDQKDTVNDNIEKEYLQRLIQESIGELSDKCQQILRLRYFRGFVVEAIKEAISSKNEEVVRSQKLRCIKSLKTIIKNKLDRSDF